MDANDTTTLARYLKHTNCKPDWVKGRLRRKPNTNDPTEVSLWNLAGKLLDGKQNHKKIVSDIGDWGVTLALSTKNRDQLTTLLKKWLNDLMQNGFGLYDRDEGHWMLIRKHNF